MGKAGLLVTVAGALAAGAGMPPALASTHAAARPGPLSSWLIAGTGAICGTPPACGDGGAATAAPLAYPTGVAVGPDGALYVADWGDNEVRKVALDGSVTAIAGDGTACASAPDCGDGGSATDAQLGFPDGVAVDRSGNVYIADTEDSEVRKVTPAGIISRLAGNGVDCSLPPSCGDGGPARSAQLSSPGGVAVDAHGDVLIADSGDNEVRRVSPDGTISTIAGDGNPCSDASGAVCGDGGPATAAELYHPQAVATDPAGNLLIADSGDNVIREVSTDGKISRVAGDGTACSSPPACGDGDRGTAAQLSQPDGVAVDRHGDVFIADDGDNEIRQLTPDGRISRAAGAGAACSASPSCGDGDSASSARFNYPDGVALDPQGDVYVADTLDNTVRWLSHAPRRAVGGLAMAVFASSTTRREVLVRFALAVGARLSLSVSTAGRPAAVVSRATAAAGLGALSWNRQLGRRAAPRGRYTLTVTATAAGHTVTESVTVRL